MLLGGRNLQNTFIRWLADFEDVDDPWASICAQDVFVDKVVFKVAATLLCESSVSTLVVDPLDFSEPDESDRLILRLRSTSSQRKSK